MSSGSEVAVSPAPRARRYRWASYFVAFCLVTTAVVRLAGAVEFFALPKCDSDSIVSTVRDIFKGKGVELDDVADAKLISEESGQKNCAARVRGQGETAAITYRVFWDGWSKKVQIGDVDVEEANSPR